MEKPIVMKNEAQYTDDVLYDKKNEYKKDVSNFIVDGNNFWPTSTVVDVLPCGYYKIRRDYTKGIFFSKLDVSLSKLVLLTQENTYKNILDDIITFWENKKRYEDRQRIYRRNILLHSAPGMGKTSLINIIIDDLIHNRNGFVISISETADILNFNDAMDVIRAAMPDKPIIVIIEDIDNFINGKAPKEVETELLNILDGIGTHNNIIILATTNYPEEMTERYINRPSRFNRVIEIKYPNDDLRREFLVKTNLKEDIESIDLEEWVRRTKGYSIDFLKELSDSVFISGNNAEETFKMLDSMIETKVVKNSKSPSETKMGFIK